MTSVVERALDMARSGDYRAVSDIERRLQKDGFDRVREHLDGRLIRRQILEAMKQANSVALNSRTEQNQVLVQR